MRPHANARVYRMRPAGQRRARARKTDGQVRQAYHDPEIRAARLAAARHAETDQPA